MKRTPNQLLAIKTLEELKKRKVNVFLNGKFLKAEPTENIPTNILVDFAVCTKEIKEMISENKK